MSANVTVRYWAAARAAAGVDQEERRGRSLDDVLAECRRDHGEELAAVLDRSSFLVDGLRANPSTDLPDGAVVEVLPPFAGG